MNMYEVIDWHNANFINDKSVNFRLKDIFADNWDNFVKHNPDLNIRPVVFKEVNKLISCRTSSLGYSVFECPHCGNLMIFQYRVC